MGLRAPDGGRPQLREEIHRGQEGEGTVLSYPPDLATWPQFFQEMEVSMSDHVSMATGRPRVDRAL